MRLLVAVLLALGAVGCLSANVGAPSDDTGAQDGAEDRGPAYDDCPEEPTCDGDGYLIWCFEEQFVEIDCIAHGATCGTAQTVGEAGDACIYP